MYYLQNRWKIENQYIKYYGMRNTPKLFKNQIKIKKPIKDILLKLPKVLDQKEIRIINHLIIEGIVVTKENYRNTPSTIENAQFCKACVANDYMIPGLEFDTNGLCPMCQSEDDIKDFKSVLPIAHQIKPNHKSRFDIALFYTGGKDSSFLLYYLSKKLGLRVLAMTWEIPFMSKSARKSIENAKKLCPNVEFITRKISDQDLSKIYTKLFSLEQNTCACPSLAYVLFYPVMVDEKIQAFVLGNEPVQMMNLYFNHFAPPIAFKDRPRKMVYSIYNIFRILTLRKPLRSGQLESILTMKQLAYGDSFFKRISGYQNQLITHVSTSLFESKEILKPLKKAIFRSNISGNIPAMLHIDFDDISDGKYVWEHVKNLIQKEVGWVPPDEDMKGLHTSCKIEKCKEYSQWMRFTSMQSQMIPFSAIEISLASKRNHVSKEEAIHEIKTHMGFSYDAIHSCQTMHAYLNQKD